MGRFKTKTVFAFLFLILFTSLTFVALLLELSYPLLETQTMSKLRSSVFLSGLGAASLAIILAVFIIPFLTRGITKPINALIEATQAVAKKEFDLHLEIRSDAEMQELIHSFNQMLQQLKSFQQQVNRRSHNLERIAKKRAKELGYIYKIGREVSSTLELNEVLDTIINSTTEVLDLKVCVMLLVDEIIADRLKVLRSQGIELKEIEKETIGENEAISGWVWHKKEALLSKDVDQDSRFLNRKKERYYKGSVISVPMEAKGKIIGVVIANNKTNGEPFKESDLLLLKEIAAESAIAIENALLYKNLKEVYVHTIAALASALEAKEHYARSHSENVTRYAVAIAEEMGLPDSQIEVVREACQLHDLGKIGIHDYILSKRDKLTPEEWDEIKLHSLRGAQILQPIGFLSEVAQLVKQHHERFDGKGYPHCLSGQDIQLGARIMAVADAFDAMSSERPYRKALSPSEVIAELRANSGTQFDPQIIELFLRVLKTRPNLIQGAESGKKDQPS